MIFIAYGHPNITAKHKTTIEFTKDKEVSLDGDCIVGVNSDFDLNEIKDFIRENKEIKVIVKVDNIEEEINCEVNKNFNNDKEIVIRKTDFVSERTLGIKANKSASELRRDLIKKLRDTKIKIRIQLESIDR